MKKIKKVGSIVCLLIVVTAIQAVSGGGIGLSIDPYEVTVKQNSTITFDITIYSYDNDCFDVTVIPYSCKIGWFDWTEKKQVYVAAGSREQILLNVTPSEEGDFEFKVKAVSIMDPGTYAISSAKINAVSDKTPDLIITKIWLAGNTIHYEVMNVGDDIAPAEWEADLYVNDIWQAWQAVNFPMGKTILYPGERLKRSFAPYELKCADTKRIKVCIENVEGEKRKDNNCLEDVLKCNQPPTCIALMPDLPQPQACGMAIVWTACAFDPEGDELQYRFLLDGPGTEGFMPIVQDWSKSNEWIWRTDERDMGYNLICADVKDGYHENNITMIYPPQDYDLSTCQWYLINLPTIVINEVELNPPEDDRRSTTMEWVELYNPIANDINLGGWTLSSTQYSGGKTFEISGTIKAKSYYVFEHSLWLHNTKGESVILRDDDGTEIDRTPLLKDDYNDDHTWQRYPNLIWDFRPPTKGYSNGG